MDARPGTRFRRRFRGYDVNLVEDALTQLDQRTGELEHEVDDLRESLLEARTDGAEAKHDLARARAELRYWNDRASYVDSEVTRARRVAIELEQHARERAEQIEADAQERSIQLVDRVCTEANQLLVAAREEARDMFLRFESEVDMSQQKLDQLEEARTKIATAMQRAMSQFSDAVRQMEQVAPPSLLMETLEQPKRRAIPTFGRQKALEAAERFDGPAADVASAALSSPLTARVEDVDASSSNDDADEQSEADVTPELAMVSVDDPEVALDVANDGASGDVDTSPLEPTKRRSHDADEEFAALLLQP